MNNEDTTSASILSLGEETSAQLRALKQEFRSLMNGPVSQTLRQHGLAYKVIFGVEVPRLKELSETMPKSHELAQALWKEDIRECRLLAPMLQPVETFWPEIADIWVDSMRYNEEAEICSLHLFQHLPYASEAAFAWIAADTTWRQVCGYLTLARLFMRRMEPNARATEEFLDQAEAALKSPQISIAHAAMNALNKFSDLGERQSFRVDKILG